MNADVARYIVGIYRFNSLAYIVQMGSHYVKLILCDSPIASLNNFTINRWPEMKMSRLKIVRSEKKGEERERE